MSTTRTFYVDKARGKPPWVGRATSRRPLRAGHSARLGAAEQSPPASPAACIQRHQANDTEDTDEKKAGANRPRNFTPEHRFSQVLEASASL
jgi:hypothetical protein